MKKVDRIIVDIFEYVSNEKTEMQIIKTKNEVINYGKENSCKKYKNETKYL